MMLCFSVVVCDQSFMNVSETQLRQEKEVRDHPHSQDRGGERGLSMTSRGCLKPGST